MKPCPSCQSDQFKKATLVHAEGQSVTVGVGAGISGGGLGVGVGRGVTKSLVAETCAPPKKPEPKLFGDTPMWLALVAFIPPMIGFAAAGSLANASYIWVVWTCLGFAYLGWKSWKPFKENEARHVHALAEYDKNFMCLRCGTLSQPIE